MVAQHAQQWDRQKGEGDSAWEAFVVYRDQVQRPRSLRDCAAAVGHGSHTQVGRWSRLWEWGVRVAAYDAWLDRVRLEGERKAVEEHSAKMATRREQQREAEWQAREKMVEKASIMLAWPLQQEIVTQRDSEGRPIQLTINPVRWGMADAANFMRLGLFLGDKSLGVEAVADNQLALGPGSIGQEQSEMGDPALLERISRVLNHATMSERDDIHQKFEQVMREAEELEALIVKVEQRMALPVIEGQVA